jgi:S1-C subfamily serine protease
MLGVLLREGSRRVDLVIPGGPAERAGIAEDDEIVRIAAQGIADGRCIARALLRREVGETVPVRVLRGGVESTCDVTLDGSLRGPNDVGPPLPGATLELRAMPGLDEADFEVQVFVASVESGSALALAGLVVSDRLIEIDARDPLVHLTRHRFRPAPDLPETIVVERAGGRVAIRIRP